MIKLAAKAGADAVKIQTVDAKMKVIKVRQNHIKNLRQRIFQIIKLKKIIKLSKKLKIIFFSTPGDVTA